MSGIVLRSTARAVLEIDASGGGLVRGAATRAVSNSATAPQLLRTSPAAIKDPRISISACPFLQSGRFRVQCRVLCITEFAKLQVLIMGASEALTLAPGLKKADSMSPMTTAEALLNAPEFTVSE